MKLMMFEKGKGVALGLVDGKSVIDLGAADPSLPKDLRSLIAAGPSALGAVKAAAAKAPASAKLALDAVKPALPIAPSGKIVCVGLNYALHAKEGGHPMPTYPSFFLRVPTSLVAAGAPVIRPKVSNQLDYECELTIVIGKKGRNIPEAKALEHVFGYTLFNDVSVRDFQRKTSQWTPGKNFDGTGPLGPWVVTSDELPPGASGLEHHDARQRRDHAGLQHLRPDLLDGEDDRAALRVHDDRARRRHRHRHTVGRCACTQAADLDEGRRQGRGGGREDRRPRQPDRRRGVRIGVRSRV